MVHRCGKGWLCRAQEVSLLQNFSEVPVDPLGSARLSTKCSVPLLSTEPTGSEQLVQCADFSYPNGVVELSFPKRSPRPRSSSLVASRKCRTLGHSLNALNQNLHFNKPPWRFVHTPQPDAPTWVCFHICEERAGGVGQGCCVAWWLRVWLARRRKCIYPCKAY